MPPERHPSAQKHGGVPDERRIGSRRSMHYAGVFTSAGTCERFTVAPHLQRGQTPAVVRFSESAPAGRGPSRRALRTMSTRFRLPDGRFTDLVTVNPLAFYVETRLGWVLVSPGFSTARYWAPRLHTWQDEVGRGRCVRYRWEPEVPAAGQQPTRPRGKDDELFEDIDRAMTTRALRFGLRIQFVHPDQGAESSVSWTGGNEIVAGRLEIICRASNQEFWNRQNFNPENLIGGIDNYPGNHPGAAEHGRGPQPAR